MTYVWQSAGQDFETAAAAVADVEERGGGEVIQFLQERNLPGCLPAYVLRSLALWDYTTEGGWTQYSIFGGIAQPMNHDKPRDY